jgi:hypothetical protein
LGTILNEAKEELARLRRKVAIVAKLTLSLTRS